MNFIFRTLACAAAGLCLLAACAPSQGPIETAEIRQTVSRDLASVYRHGPDKETGKKEEEKTQKAGPEKLTLEEVLARALKYNLDTKVAELDELIAADDVSLQALNALPSVTAKIQRHGRSNPGGSSSFSLLTGTQSLQPSISSDQYRDVQQLNLEWNFLDAGINLWRARSASDRVLIAQERRRKIYHNVVQDAYTAYWRVAVAQMALPRIEDLLKQTEERAEKLDEQLKAGTVPLADVQNKKTELLNRRQQLVSMKEQMSFAEIELKTLIDYPPAQPIAVVTSGADWLAAGSLPKVKGAAADLETTAFLNRPELREELLNKRISVRDIRHSVVETLPGAELIFSYNRDSNSFLSYNSWVDGIGSITHAINKIITAPSRIKRAQNLDELADKRRHALLAAIITQVYVARARYDFLAYAYGEYERVADNASQILKRAKDFSTAGLMSGEEFLNVTIDESIADINRALAYAEAQDAYGRLITTLGVDLWEADAAGQNVPAFARHIRKKLSDKNIFLTADDSSGEVKG